MALLSTGIMRGNIGDRPAAGTATAGRLYISVDEGKIYRDNGSTWDEVPSSAAGSHAAITLAADADTLLGLSGQEVGLDNQDANKVLAGPTTGAAADPAFRALVAADIPAITEAKLSLTDVTTADASATAHGFLPKLSNTGTKFLRDDGTYQTVTGVAPGTHATSHQNGGDDEINVGGLSGELADAQPPKSHDNTAHSATYITSAGVTYENLDAAGDVGTSAGQLAIGNHTHEATGIQATLIDAEGDLIIGTADNTAGRLAVGTAGYALVSRSSRPAYEAQYAPFALVIDGGGAAITTGVKLDFEVPYACQLVAWTLLADQDGAIKIDVWRDTYANFPPTDADSLTNAHEPEIAATAAKAQDTDLADWTDTTLDAGDILRLNVDSCTTITRVSLCFKVLRL